MFVQMKRIVVKEGFSDLVLNRFSGEGKLEKQPGYIDRTVMKKNVRRGDEEVIVYVRWDSESDWKNWEKHPDHIAGHKANLGKPKPEHIIETSQSTYHVHAVR
ncbi:antibiotic biosynthesis monooxygenase [Planococcus shenhongbingii]|uniref:Antibiotic biosynthesis monooxygenase n=1 Tax=Planococcus shenhongbingii TaxID=3058398 RepID=A0ABT8NFF8_9BACL|nr:MULTISPECIES: antibiotic biosynthesis monooxygenase [unclassified Planococcus (in: firmicutes)]MDN7246629.1 antibiotic biosynthesis monooxygenase [Planococcus sp. N017]WKA59010.1 antibiotic biosynthesis monooxygenase [Planococcus sp. N016]